MAYKIMIVDDEENVRNSLIRLLRREGFDLVTASSATEAMEILLEETVDLIISDEKMPGMSGLEFLKLVRQRHPETMRFILTGHADPEFIIRAINEGEIYRFFTKPWDNEDMKAAIRSALQYRELIRENRRLHELVHRQEEELALLRKGAAKTH